MLPQSGHSILKVRRRAAVSIRAALAFIALSFTLVGGCGDDGGTQPESQPAVHASEPILYDGSLHDPIGPFHITDLRSRMIAAGADSIDLYYGMVDYETRNLTVFHSPDAVDRPVIFFIHGGAWIDEYMEWYDFVPESFTGGEGYITVVINYRLTSEEVYPSALCPTKDSPPPDPSLKAAYYPDNIRDCADAFQWTIDHIAGYGGDPEQIFVFGHSAGGHLASLLATHPDYAALRSHMRGVITMSGAYSLKDLNLAVFGSALDQTFRTHSDEAVLNEASPVSYLEAGSPLPPFLVLYAEDELPSLTAQALTFVTRMSETGHGVESEHLAGYGHVSEMTAIEFPHEAPTARILRFISDRLE